MEKKYFLSEAKPYFSTNLVAQQWCSRIGASSSVSKGDFIPSNLIEANLQAYSDRFISQVKNSQDFQVTQDLKNLFSKDTMTNGSIIRCYNDFCDIVTFKDLNPFSAGIGNVKVICQENS